MGIVSVDNRAAWVGSVIDSPAYAVNAARLPTAIGCASGGRPEGSTRNGSGLWKLRRKPSSIVVEKKSATGWPRTSIPAASMRTVSLVRGDFGSASSAGPNSWVRLNDSSLAEIRLRKMPGRR